MQKDMIDGLRHPSESSRYWLAVLATTPLLLLGLLLTFASFGLLVLIALMTVGAVWFAVVLLEAHLKANLVQVSEHNFPEVKAVVDECRRGLCYEPTVELYVQEGNATRSSSSSSAGSSWWSRPTSSTRPRARSWCG